MTLTHDGGAPITLRPYQVHAFDGGADTHSAGRCVDFNLMLRKGACRGRIFPVTGQAAQTLCPEVSPDAEELLLYCVEGRGRVFFCGEAAELHPGEAVRVRAPGGGGEAIRPQPGGVPGGLRLYGRRTGKSPRISITFE